MRAQLKGHPSPGGPALDSLDRFARQKLADLERAHLRRTLLDTARTDGIWMTRNGRRLLSFSCNDYLNLSSPRSRQGSRG